MGRQGGTRCIQGKNKGMLHYLHDATSVEQDLTLKALSSSTAGYAKISFSVCFLPARPVSVQHFKGLASSPSLWQQHHHAPKIMSVS